MVKNPPANGGDTENPGSILSLEDPLEEEMPTDSSILVGIILGTEKPGGLLSMELQRVGHD